MMCWVKSGRFQLKFTALVSNAAIAVWSTDALSWNLSVTTSFPVEFTTHTGAVFRTAARSLSTKTILIAMPARVISSVQGFPFVSVLIRKHA
jgi:hypothetical protein